MLDQSKHESTIQPAYIGSSIHQEKWGNILSIRTPTCRVYYWLLTANLLFFHISFYIPGSFCVLLSLFSRKNQKKKTKRTRKHKRLPRKKCTHYQHKMSAPQNANFAFVHLFSSLCLIFKSLQRKVETRVSIAMFEHNNSRWKIYE